METDQESENEDGDPFGGVSDAGESDGMSDQQLF